MILLSTLLISSGVIVRYYNEINHQDYKTYEEFSAGLLSNVTGGDPLTTTNVLIGVYEPQVCSNFLTHLHPLSYHIKASS